MFLCLSFSNLEKEEEKIRCPHEKKSHILLSKSRGWVSSGAAHSMDAGGLSFLLLLVSSWACSSQEAVAVLFVFSLYFLSLSCTEGIPHATALPRHKNNFLNIHSKVHHSEGTVNSNSFSFMITSSVRPPQIHSHMSTSSYTVTFVVRDWLHCRLSLSTVCKLLTQESQLESQHLGRRQPGHQLRQWGRELDLWHDTLTLASPLLETAVNLTPSDLGG